MVLRMKLTNGDTMHYLTYLTFEDDEFLRVMKDGKSIIHSNLKLTTNIHIIRLRKYQTIFLCTSTSTIFSHRPRSRER